MIAITSISRYGKYEVLLKMFWCWDACYGWHKLYWRKAQNVEYSSDKLTGKTSLYAEAEDNSEATAWLYTEMHPQWHPNGRALIRLQETGHMWPSITKAGKNTMLHDADMEEHIKDYLVLVPGRWPVVTTFPTKLWWHCCIISCCIHSTSSATASGLWASKTILQGLLQMDAVSLTFHSWEWWWMKHP